MTPKQRTDLNQYLAELKLGDRLDWLFRKTGIKAIVKWINPNCNCDYRQQKFNEFQIKIKRK